MDGWTDGWMDGCADGHMNRWIMSESGAGQSVDVNTRKSYLNGIRRSYLKHI